MWFRNLFKKKGLAVVVDTNIPLYYVGGMHEEGFLENLKGVIFIPWSVLFELSTMWLMVTREKEVRKNGTAEEIEKLEEFLSQLSPEEQRMRRTKSIRIPIAYPFVQKKIEQGKWKLIGSDTDIKPYLEGFNGRVEKKVKRSDAKILACCLFLADGLNFKKVVLLTRDKDLRDIAKEWGIQTEGALSEVIKN